LVKEIFLGLLLGCVGITKAGLVEVITLDIWFRRTWKRAILWMAQCVTPLRSMSAGMSWRRRWRARRRRKIAGRELRGDSRIV